MGKHNKINTLSESTEIAVLLIKLFVPVHQIPFNLVIVLYFNDAFYIWKVRVISTILLFAALMAMLYGSIGQVGGVYVSINNAKDQAVTRLHEEKLSTLTISGSDLSSGRAHFTAKNEILYNGKLYDIASQTKEGGNITLQVLRDEKEESLLSDLKDIVDGWINGTQKDSKHPLLKQLVIIKDFMPASKFIFNCTTIMKELPSGSLSYHTEAPLLAVLKSPPQFV